MGRVSERAGAWPPVPSLPSPAGGSAHGAATFFVAPERTPPASVRDGRVRSVSPVVMASTPVSQSVREYARGVGGGLLFSLPLFYTMETWAIGASASPLRLLAFLVGTLGLLVAYNRVAGIRGGHTWREDVLESVEELGLGLLVAVGLLALLGRLPPDPFSFEALGLVAVEGMVAAIGVSVGTAQLGQSPDGDAESDGDAGEADPRDAADDDTGIGLELILALCGAVLVASNVAPTEEVLLIGSEMTPWALVGLVGVSLAAGGALLYFSTFRGSGRLAGGALGPWRGTVVTYAVALLASAAMLWVFGQFGASGWAAMPRLVAVLGFPAMLGAAAGRLLLLSDS